MTVFFRGISFVWALAALACLVVVLGLRAWLVYRRLRAEAGADWDYRVSQNMQDLRLSKDGFVRAYYKVNAPRVSLYMAGGAALILALTPIAFAVINFGLWGVWKFSGESRVFEPGYLVWEFFIFFALIAFWTSVCAFVARRYHARAPGLMRDELTLERANFSPKQSLTVGANPVHIHGHGDAATYHKMFADILGLTHSHDKNWNNTGHICGAYTGGDNMKICVHSATKGGAFDENTHPFFFTQKHAREDIETEHYTIVILMQNTYSALEKIKKLGLLMDKTTGNKNSKMCSFAHANIEVFLYEDV